MRQLQIDGHNGKLVLCCSDQVKRQVVLQIVKPCGLEVRVFDNADEILVEFSGDSPPQSVGCLMLVDSRIDSSEVSAWEQLRELFAGLPTSIISVCDEPPHQLVYMRHGSASQLLIQRCSARSLQDALSNVFRSNQVSGRLNVDLQAAARKLARLSEGHHQVLRLLLQGKLHKTIASKLDVSARTVENRRRQAYEAAGVDSLAELVRVCVAIGYIDNAIVDRTLPGPSSTVGPNQGR